MIDVDTVDWSDVAWWVSFAVLNPITIFAGLPLLGALLVWCKTGKWENRHGRINGPRG